LVKHLLVVIVTEIYAVMACSAPVYAFQINSATGYARVVSQAAQQAYIASHRAQVISSLAPAISAAGAGSVAVRAVAGPIGWASLAVSAGLVIAGMLYDATERQQVKDNAASYAGVPSTMIGGNGSHTFPAGSSKTTDTCGGTYPSGCVQIVTEPNSKTNPQCGLSVVQSWANPLPSGWSFLGEAWPSGGPCTQTYRWQSNGSNAAQAVQTMAGVPTTQNVSDYLASLPSSNALAPESQNQPAGTTNPAPAGSTSTTNIPVSPSDMPTTVVPANTVPPGSSVVDPNAPAPTQQTQTTQQSSTTTTTTNPDGSQTDQSSATVSCTSGQHSNRTFGSVLQDHYNVWSASGLLGTLELLKNLSWPTTFPTYTLHSTVMGTFTFEFNAWSGVINALRALVIAGASFVAYRIIFIGGH
jgi:hypothetical protein